MPECIGGKPLAGILLKDALRIWQITRTDLGPSKHPFFQKPIIVKMNKDGVGPVMFHIDGLVLYSDNTTSENTFTAAVMPVPLNESRKF